MKIGVFLVLFSDRSLDNALQAVSKLGAERVEIGTGGFPGSAHLDAAGALADSAMRDALRAGLDQNNLEISALSCHGNALHPLAEVAAQDDQVFRDTVRLAAELGVSTVITFSGQPGDREAGQTPNWVTQIWPPDFGELLNWQWTERAGPYWAEAAEFARELGVKVAIELHPGFLAYNTSSFQRMRREAGAAGANLYVNFDPSHLFWQQMDPLECVDNLGDAIAHVHAKDTAFYSRNVALNGVLDTAPFEDLRHRSWSFRSVGYGHDTGFWRALVSHLRLAGYDGTLSIEHEDALMSVDEGLARAFSTLRDAIMTEPPPNPWWT
ncbi:MAG: sugar phosphate isomerase/epimerase family protein [Candidatus Dormibacteria bacterium]